jgi:hypothetical protein
MAKNGNLPLEKSSRSFARGSIEKAAKSIGRVQPPAHGMFLDSNTGPEFMQEMA